MSLNSKGMGYFVAYVKSMRLYFGFITGIAGWVGVSYYYFIQPDQINTVRSIIVLVLLFLSYGINQVVNDFLGLPEDRINAPSRPMVTGELPAIPALVVSLLLMTAVALLSMLFNPWAALPVVAGVLLNILYNYAKSWSLAGNLVFGLSISTCTLFGFLASGPLPDELNMTASISGLIMIVLLNSVMTFFTYFKDYKGDKQTGKKTFVVRYGLRNARYMGLAGALLPIAFILLCIWVGLLNVHDLIANRPFLFCVSMTQFLLLWTAWRYYLFPFGEKTYLNLSVNIRACVSGQITLIALFDGQLSLYLFAACYVLIGAFFELHKDTRA